MGLLSTLGGIAGSIFGGPVGGAVGSALGGALDSSGSSGSSAVAQQATNATQAATDKSIALQREMWQAQQAQQQPWLQSGVAAQNRLMTLLGVNPTTANAPTTTGGSGGGFGVLGGLDLSGLSAATGGAGGAAPTYKLNVDPNSPDYGKYARDFSMADYQADPGYNFRLTEGLKRLGHAAGARGGLISGQTLKGLQDYTQESASNEYQNAYNRYQTNRANQLNPLQSLAGVGQTSSNTLGAAGQAYGQNVGNALINQGYTAGNALLGANAANQSTYGNIGNALGKVSASDWTSAGNKLSNWWNTPSQNSGGYSNLEF